MRHLQSFESFLNEAFQVDNKVNQGTKMTIKTELSFGKISTPIYFFVGQIVRLVTTSLGKRIELRWRNL
jgi:hypothetical protein